MSSLAEYATNFEPHPIPPELKKLFKFSELEQEFFCDGFELTVDPTGGAETYSEDPDFTGAIFTVAQATGSGSIYAFWAPNGSKLAKAPIVVLDDEGGIRVAASDLRELFRLLTVDVEPMSYGDSVSYHREPDEEHSERHEEFLEWLDQEFGIEPIEDGDAADALVAAADAKHGDAWRAWFKKYCQEEY